MTRTEYHAYLASWRWRIKRTLVRLRALNRCERCRWSRMSAAHHLTYERIGHERLKDLQAVCYSCHRFVHCRSAHDPSRVPLWRRLLVAVLFGHAGT